MQRYDLIEKYIDKRGHGVEIGPSHNPIAPKRAGFKVDIIDHTDRSGLLEKYKEHGVNLDNIEEVDFIWSGEKYSEITGRSRYYDWVIASHVIEHVPDFISFINGCHEILNGRGVLILAVPDSTRCFDYFRQITSISGIIDAHISGNKIHTVGTAVDHVLNVCTMDGNITWNTMSNGEFRFMHSMSDAKSHFEQAAEGVTYLDYHAWCFTPHSFRILIEDLYNLGLICVREVTFIPTDGFEFFIVLGGKGEGPKQSRLQMMKKMKREIAQEKTVIKQLYFSLLRLRNRFVRRA
ncbi:MAG TPA: hypothetical protein VN642_09655 [Dongiaceae bacterium]|nr:hypothetical protein [Dongiaceae bacterium]